MKDEKKTTVFFSDFSFLALIYENKVWIPVVFLKHKLGGKITILPWEKSEEINVFY